MVGNTDIFWLVIDFVTFLLYIGILKSVKPFKVKLLCKQILVSLDIFSQILGLGLRIKRPLTLGRTYKLIIPLSYKEGRCSWTLLLPPSRLGFCRAHF